MIKLELEDFTESPFSQIVLRLEQKLTHFLDTNKVLDRGEVITIKEITADIHQDVWRYRTPKELVEQRIIPAFIRALGAMDYDKVPKKYLAALQTRLINLRRYCVGKNHLLDIPRRFENYFKEVA